MKHVPPTEVIGEARAKPPTRRALAKQQTRAKVLAAARQLFSEHGYEGATIRDIAAAAGMSTGAVFANFSDKSDLFREIMISDIEALTAQIHDALAKARGIEDALLKIFTTGYAFYRSQMPLARAAFSVSWAPKDGEVLRNVVPINALEQLMLDELTAAVERGELGQEAEVKLRAQMLYESFLANFRHAIFRGWSLDALQARARDQIRVILAGARRG
jgi:AcrR family transcriptional regulator